MSGYGKKRLFLGIYALLLTLSGCVRDDGQERVYVDTKEAIEHIGEADLNIKSGPDTYKDFQITGANEDSDESFFYSEVIIDHHLTNVRVDLKSGRVSGICAVPGCLHDEKSAGCANKYIYTSGIHLNGGLFYVSGASLYFQKDSKSERLYSNRFCTDFAKENYAGNQYSLSGIALYENLLYLVGIDFYMTYDPVTGMVSEPVTLCEGLIYTFVPTKDYCYFTTDSEELIRYEKATGEIMKIADKCARCCEYDGSLMYVQYEAGVPSLYRSGYDGSDPERLIENCWVNFAIKDGYIYYQSYAGESRLFLYDMSCGTANELTLKYDRTVNGKKVEYRMGNPYDIYSSDTLGAVFICDHSEALFFVFEPGSADYAVIDASDASNL